MEKGSVPFLGRREGSEEIGSVVFVLIQESIEIINSMDKALYCATIMRVSWISVFI